jgi:predicted RNase H-like HicB family nuclease
LKYQFLFVGKLIVLDLTPLNGEGQVMKYFSFEIVIEKEPKDEGYFAYSPTIPGCLSNGKTIEQTKRNIREAVAQHIDSLRASGELIPQSERIVHVEELTVGVPE